jgi:NAD(P)-dependent dehydrogenase (short-subunit alcohol dehydrogenase family)
MFRTRIPLNFPRPLRRGNFRFMPNVLVTGAGRGIGRTIATHLADKGWDVYAGVRKDADGAAVAAHAPDRIHPVVVDITSADDVAALPKQLPDRLDAVVNNAGIAVGGAIESLDVDDLRYQYEVNVFGQVAVTQAVLPLLRAARGRVVFVSSVSGRVSTPLTGAYNSSKFALEGLADALRVELRPWGIHVSLIEPAQTDTEMWQQAEHTLDAEVAKLSPEHRQLYAAHIEGFRKIIPLSQRIAAPPQSVAAAVQRALTARSPRARYVVGVGPKIQVRLTNATPTRIRDAVLRRVFRIPSKA